ncbi:MAG: PilZ domain-containing protein [Gammaproteobacteria bacterium]|nr:PilZ domain-containing protein [Gammaproteobacteria bacterium]
MEKRKQSRAEVVVNVEMHYRDIHAQGLRTRNVSLGGVFVEAGDYPLPRKGETVNLQVVNGGAPGTGRNFRTRVARSNEDGVALLFQDFDLDDFEYLQEILD